MNSSSFPSYAFGKPAFTFKRLLALYVVVAVIPYVLAVTQDLESRGIFQMVVELLNITVFTALLSQYFLSGRVSAVSDRVGVDNGMKMHRRAGEYIALYFFLHPLLIISPRFFVSPQRTLGDLWDVFIAPEASTGVFAWALMGIWVLASRYRTKLGWSYEAWRFSHGIGFAAIAILATHHVVTVGRHGRYNAWFDGLWIVLCTLCVAVVAYVYFIRPYRVKRRPFKVVGSEKISDSDWELTIEKDGAFDFEFAAGQFLWINTSGNAFTRTEHPFSIASSPEALPRVSFVIRELGDYTSRLGELKPGARVYVDGPHGVFTLQGREEPGIGLIAGGAGIGPILGLLRQLRDGGDSRAIRLVYGNRTFGQMVHQDEIRTIAESLEHCEQRLVLESPSDGIEAMHGRIDEGCLRECFPSGELENWVFYVCGPPIMVRSVVNTLKSMGVSARRLNYEELAF